MILSTTTLLQLLTSLLLSSAVVCTCVIVVFLVRLFYLNPRRLHVHFSSQPGVVCTPWKPLQGTLPEMTKADQAGDILKFFRDCRECYGPVHHTVYGVIPALCLWEPKTIRDVLRTNKHCYIKSSAEWKLVLAPLLGNGLLMSEGSLWKRQRKVLSPFFHFEQLKSMVQLMGDATQRVMQRWEAARVERGASACELDLQHEISDMTLEIVATAAFGPTFVESEEMRRVVHHAFSTVLQDLQDRGTQLISVIPGVRHLPVPSYLRVRSGCKAIEAAVRRVVRDRLSGRNKPVVGKDLLDILVACTFQDGGESGQRMSEQQMIDEAVTFVFAAFETVANCFQWLVWLLGTHPDKLAKCYEEVDRVLGDSASDNPTYEQLKELHYLEAVFFESLRLYPPANLIAKYCIKENVIGDGIVVPKGAYININSYIVHRSPELWPEPNAFKPERWLDKQAAKTRDPFSFLAFSEGQRSCLGRNFAILEAKVMLGLMLQRYSLSIPPGQDVRPTYRRLNLVPRDSLRIIMTPRNKKA